jgi:hypothetical protein
MQALMESVPAALPRSHGKPILDSYDSGEEFSFHHWLEVCKLVDETDDPLAPDAPPYAAEIEQALQEAILKMESATAYQNFTRDVV